ncbi:MAG: hypothetical protein RQ859_01625 [Pyrobaculum sp.]|nr:hypothetical protein [Pyrobaculum sp.]
MRLLRFQKQYVTFLGKAEEGDEAPPVGESGLRRRGSGVQKHPQFKTPVEKGEGCL